MFCEIVKINRLFVIVKVKENYVQVNDNYYDNRGDFDYRELEFDFVV